MCLIHTNKTADETLDKIRSSFPNIERRLARLAEDATPDDGNCGIEPKLHTVKDWVKRPDLRSVRKYKTSGHRFYVVGRNSDCNYYIRHVIAYKRSEDDQAHTKWFQQMIMKSVTDEAVSRTLEPPPREYRERDEVVDADN